MMDVKFILLVVGCFFVIVLFAAFAGAVFINNLTDGALINAIN